MIGEGRGRGRARKAEDDTQYYEYVHEFMIPAGHAERSLRYAVMLCAVSSFLSEQVDSF